MGLLRVSTQDDRFVVRVAGVDHLTVRAAEITALVTETEYVDNWAAPALRIEHTAPGVESPIILFLRPDHPVHREIQRLRPEVVTVPTDWGWQWRPRVFGTIAVLGTGFGLMAWAADDEDGVLFAILMGAFITILAASFAGRRWG